MVQLVKTYVIKLGGQQFNYSILLNDKLYIQMTNNNNKKKKKKNKFYVILDNMRFNS